MDRLLCLGTGLSGRECLHSPHLHRMHAVILHPTSPQGHTGEGSQDLLRSWLRSVNILQGSHSLLYMVGLFLEMAA